MENVHEMTYPFVTPAQRVTDLSIYLFSQGITSLVPTYLS